MNALTEIETLYVLKLTRLEAARALCDPKELQVALRGILSPADETGEPKPELPRNGHGAQSKALLPGALLPTTKKLMRKFKKQGQRKPCPHCGKAFKRLGLHLVKAHRVGIEEMPSEPEPVEAH